MKPGKKLKDQGKTEIWDGTEGKGLPNDMKPYNHQAIDQARELKKTLWICEGEKDAVTMTEAGELAAAIPSASMTKVFNGVFLEDIPEVIIAFDNDDAGRNATEKLKNMFPFAKVVMWPSILPKGYDVTDASEELERESLTEGLRQFVRPDTWEDEGDLIDIFLQDLRREKPSVKTGFKGLDEKIDGLIPGGLHVIQGSSSIGKTTFCKQLADQIHLEYPAMPIFFFALEDSLRTVRAMTFSRLSKIENKKIRKGGEHLTEAEHNKLKETAAEVKEIYGRDYHLVAGESDINVRTIKDRVKDKLTRTGKTTALVIVDYLQILPTPKEERLGSLMDRIDFNLHELQCLARDIDGPVILTSSTTKKDVEDTGKDRTPGQTKGKGSVNILYTPRMLLELLETDTSEARHRKVELHVLKNSEGIRDVSQSFKYYPQYSVFDEI